MSTGETPRLLAADGGRAVLTLDKGIYPLDVVYGAAYVLIDRAYVLLGKAEGGGILVELTSKRADAPDEELRALAGEFSSELLNQALRKRLARDNQGLLESIVTQALAGASGAMVPTALADDEDDDDLDFLDDPLGIAVPWEERFKKAGAAPEKGGPDAEREAGPGDSGGFTPTDEA